MLQKKEYWSSKLSFILNAAGSAIGLGILWKFPYLLGENGGGCFLIIFLIAILFLGLPLFIGELLLGRATGSATVRTFTNLAPDSNWKIVGWLSALPSFLIMSYYSVVAGWTLNFAFMSINGFYTYHTRESVHHLYDILAQSGSVSIFWHAIFTALTTGIVMLGLKKGIEYWGSFLTKLLFVLLVGLFIYCTTLPGFGKAMTFAFYPNFAQLKAASILKAVGTAFLTLSLGQGIMITYGRYLNQETDLPKMSGIVGSMLLLVGVLALSIIFPIVFTFDMMPDAGVGLAFKTLPSLFIQLPGALLISTLFFLLLFFTALTSAIPLIEVVAANFIDLYGWKRPYVVLGVGMTTFLLGIVSALPDNIEFQSNWKSLYGMNFFATIDNFSTIWLLALNALLTSVFLGWKLDSSIIHTEFNKGTSLKWLWHPWYFSVRYLVPAAIICILLHEVGLLKLES